MAEFDELSKPPSVDELERCFSAAVTASPVEDRRAKLEPLLAIGGEEILQDEQAKVKDLLWTMVTLAAQTWYSIILTPRVITLLSNR